MARIAFLTPQLPHPPVSGGVIKSRKMVEYLSERHDLYLFSLLKGKDTDNIDSLSRSVRLKEFHCTPVGIPRSAVNFVRSLVVGVPLSVYRNRSPVMQGMVDRVIHDVDVVFVDHFLMFQFVPETVRARVVLHEHNAEYVMWRRFAKVERNPLRKTAGYMEALRVRAYEQRIGKRSDCILAAPNDIDALVSIGIPRNRFIETLHLGDERLLGLPDIAFDDTEPRLLFVGSLEWEANRDGLLWFLREVWPRLIRTRKDLQFTIIGGNPGEEIEQEAARFDAVELLGFVDHLDPHYARSRVFVAPLRFGSGIKVKVINALYRGLPVSTTSVGVEGLRIEGGCQAFVADDAAEIAEGIGVLLTDADRWRMMRDASRELARKEYTWQASLMRIEEAIHG